jgi:predicted anti-sigma-YlaC factor YlaD
MLNIKHLLKVSAAWISVVYAVCFLGVAFWPGVRQGFMMYGLHVKGLDMGQDVLTLGTFISGLIIWNIVALLAVWLFAFLFNSIKK